MSIVKVGYNEYEIRCNLCGEESAEVFTSKIEARQFIENNKEDWRYDDENGIICSSCRNHRFDISNNKYYKKIIPKVRKTNIITVEEEKLKQYLQDKESEIIEYYKLKYKRKNKATIRKIIISLFNQSIDIAKIYNALKQVFNISEDVIYKIVENETYNKKYGID